MSLQPPNATAPASATAQLSGVHVHSSDDIEKQRIELKSTLSTVFASSLLHFSTLFSPEA